MKFELPFCEECGASRVPHRLEKLADVLDDLANASPLSQALFTRADTYIGKALEYTFTPDRTLALLRALARLRIVRLHAEPSPDDSTRTLALYEGAKETGVRLYTATVGSVAVGCIAEKREGDITRRVAFRVIPRPANHRSHSLTWMDDKAILKSHLTRAGIPCAEGGSARTEDEAVAIWKKVNAPVITKPHHGSRGRHTSLDLRTEEDVRRGFSIAAQLATQVVVERYLHGSIHRVTLVGKKPVAIAKREYPHVIGDGVHTVEELIDIENQNPLRDGIFYKKLDKRYRVDENLKKQQLTLHAIPEEGQLVILSDKNSRLHGTVTEDVTDTVHPDNIELFTRLADLLDDPIVGVDFMIEDMRRSYKEQPDAGVIECNSMPFIDVHHRVVSGRTINVAAHLWHVVFT